jgi:hypothetical protein
VKTPLSRNPQKTVAWTTSDGRTFTDETEAAKHQDRVDFTDWCRENICCGGEWSYDMVAAGVLRHWHVSPKQEAP